MRKAIICWWVIAFVWWSICEKIRKVWFQGRPRTENLNQRKNAKGRAYAKVTCVCIWNLDADTCAAAYFNSMPFSSLASLSLSLGGELKRELRGSTTPLSLSLSLFFFSQRDRPFIIIIISQTSSAAAAASEWNSSSLGGGGQLILPYQSHEAPEAHFWPAAAAVRSKGREPITWNQLAHASLSNTQIIVNTCGHFSK